MKYQYTDSASIKISISVTPNDIERMLRWFKELKKPSHPDEFELIRVIAALKEAKLDAANALRVYVNDLEAEMENNDAF